MVIYGILNKVNGKYYIGSAVDFSKRKRRHLKLLRENKHHSYLLQKEWKSSKEASLNGYLAKYIIECCKNKRKKYKNSLWQYKK